MSFILLLMLSISFIYPFISLGGGVLRQGLIESRQACNYLAEVSIELLISLPSTSQTLGLQAQSPYLTCILLKSEKKKSFKFLSEDLVSIKIWFPIHGVINIQNIGLNSNKGPILKRNSYQEMDYDLNSVSVF